MNDRIHAWLDGELPFEALTPEERREARIAESIMEAAREATPASGPDLTDRVMMALPPGPPKTRSRRVWESVMGVVAPSGARLWLRPAALAALSMLIGFGLGQWTAEADTVPAGTAATAAEAPEIYVRFEVQAPDAQDVRLAGSFTEWQPSYELTPVGDGRWTAMVPLRPGVHDYVYVVDGDEYVTDPGSPRIADGFGSFNNRIALLTSNT